uniref:HNH endonuclease signature motif containing protein n=1 Tax=Mycolicibacterium stellerae TaxID=2358193 RepID=UPI0013DE5FA8
QVARYDPDAQRRTHTAVRGRDFTIGACDDDAETTAVWGRLLAHDAAVGGQRITAMINGVCDGDPRSAGERRSDAVGALFNGNDTLACRCGSPACPTAGVTPKSDVVIRVIADQAAINDATDQPAEPTDKPDGTADNDATDQPEATAQSATAASGRRPRSPGLLVGHGVLPNTLLAEAIRNGATIKPIRMPDAAPEPRYRPSDELAEFVRMRDLFCRFPGCTVAADRCDIDHVIPWPLGPTHPSNLNCKCRRHHLMKTFWTGIGGWADKQLPDATVIWTAPSGKTYTTQPGSRLFFPTWNVTTTELPPATKPPPHAERRGLMMPRRQRTRTADEAAAIQAERRLNEVDIPPY